MDEFLERVNANPFDGFETWLESLSDNPMDGFRSECWSWMNAWGAGGGSCDTEMRAKAAIEECEVESPRSIADAVYHSVVDYSESPMSASCITRIMIEESEAELRAR